MMAILTNTPTQNKQLYTHFTLSPTVTPMLEFSPMLCSLVTIIFAVSRAAAALSSFTAPRRPKVPMQTVPAEIKQRRISNNLGKRVYHKYITTVHKFDALVDYVYKLKLSRQSTTKRSTIFKPTKTTNSTTHSPLSSTMNCLICPPYFMKLSLRHSKQACMRSSSD